MRRRRGLIGRRGRSHCVRRRRGGRSPALRWAAPWRCRWHPARRYRMRSPPGRRCTAPISRPLPLRSAHHTGRLSMIGIVATDVGHQRIRRRAGRSWPRRSWIERILPEQPDQDHICVRVLPCRSPSLAKTCFAVTDERARQPIGFIGAWQSARHWRALQPDRSASIVAGHRYSDCPDDDGVGCRRLGRGDGRRGRHRQHRGLLRILPSKRWPS